MQAAARVKICGITRVEDAECAVAAGADAIGLIFYPPSPRNLSDLGLARQIASAVGPFVTVTALFVNPEVAWVEQVLNGVPAGLLQFHGDESAEFCEQFNRPYMKVLRMKPGLDVAKVAADYTGASAILLDAYSPDRAGGTGEAFDWARVPDDLGRPIVLAGGLTPANVAQAVARTRPYAVDVCGGVEADLDGRKRHGIKDSAKVAAFVSRAKFGDKQ